MAVPSSPFLPTSLTYYVRVVCRQFCLVDTELGQLRLGEKTRHSDVVNVLRGGRGRDINKHIKPTTITRTHTSKLNSEEKKNWLSFEMIANKKN